MKQPYENAIAKHFESFDTLGFRVSANADDEIMLSDGRHSIKIGIQKHYPLKLTVGVIDAKGVTRALALLEESIDPEMTASIRSRLRDFVAEWSLEKKSFLAMSEDGSLERYIDLEISLMVQFFRRHKREVLDLPDDVSKIYDAKRKQMLERLGLSRIAKQ